MLPQIQEINALATKYTKPQLAQMAQMGQIDPTTAVMAGMMIDRIVMDNVKAPTSTVAEDIMGGGPAPVGTFGQPQPQQMGMAQPQQAPQRGQTGGLEALPIPDNMYNDESFAGGGMVAFADGGDVPRYAAAGQISLESIRGGRGKHPNEDMVIAEARRQGVDPSLALYKLYRETGGLAAPTTAVSPKGATGLMQIMPATAMDPGFGVPNIFQIAESQGINVPKKDAATAKKLLKDPELNTAFGLQYSTAMADKFQDPRLAAAAYNAGPGAVTRAGGVPNFPETQRYVADLPGGAPARAPNLGGVPLYEDIGGGTGVADPNAMFGGTAPSAAPRAGLPQIISTDPDRLRGPAQARIYEQMNPSERIDYETTGVIPPAAKDRFRQTEIDKLIPPAAPRAATPSPVPPAAQAAPVVEPGLAAAARADEDQSEFALLRKSIEDQRASSREEAKQDKYMALLSAGLGIMGGTSPNALQNIGAGARQGLTEYASARKGRREEEKDLITAETNLARFKTLEDYRKDQLAQTAEANKSRAAMAQQLADIKRSGNYREAVKMWADSEDKVALEQDLEKRFGKKWRSNKEAEGIFNMGKNRFLSTLISAGNESDVVSAAELLAR
jgi:soluble lytic murein transglycosylase-like protein